MVLIPTLPGAPMSQRTVLITGGAGYIGSHCAQTLQAAGIETVVYDDLSTGYRAAVDCEFVEGDIRDRDKLTKVLRSRPFDGVLHFAAKLLVGESVAHPLRYYDTNVAGTTSLLQAMKTADVGVLVFSSTCAIYGNPDYLPLDEDHPTRPVSPYGVSKLMVEQILDACREREDFKITSLRYFNAAGADPSGKLGESHDPETHLIPLALNAAKRGDALRVFGRDYPTPDGTCVRDYIHVSDLAEAHRAAIETMWDGAPGRAYNCGTGKGASVLEVLDAVERVTGLPLKRIDAPRRDGDPAGLYAKADRLRTDLNWTPKYEEIDAIVETAWQWAQAPRY